MNTKKWILLSLISLNIGGAVYGAEAEEAAAAKPQSILKKDRLKEHFPTNEIPEFDEDHRFLCSHERKIKFCDTVEYCNIHVTYFTAKKSHYPQGCIASQGELVLTGWERREHPANDEFTEMNEEDHKRTRKVKKLYALGAEVASLTQKRSKEEVERMLIDALKKASNDEDRKLYEYFLLTEAESEERAERAIAERARAERNTQIVTVLTYTGAAAAIGAAVYVWRNPQSISGLRRRFARWWNG